VDGGPPDKANPSRGGTQSHGSGPFQPDSRGCRSKFGLNGQYGGTSAESRYVFGVSRTYLSSAGTCQLEGNSKGIWIEFVNVRSRILGMRVVACLYINGFEGLRWQKPVVNSRQCKPLYYV